MRCPTSPNNPHVQSPCCTFYTWAIWFLWILVIDACCFSLAAIDLACWGHAWSFYSIYIFCQRPPCGQIVVDCDYKFIHRFATLFYFTRKSNTIIYCCIFLLSVYRSSLLYSYYYHVYYVYYHVYNYMSKYYTWCIITVGPLDWLSSLAAWRKDLATTSVLGKFCAAHVKTWNATDWWPPFS